MDLLLASDLNQASQPAAAWRARVAAYPVLSGASSVDRIRSSLLSAIYAESAQGKFEAANALAAIAVDELQHAKEPMAISTAEAARAEALADLGDVAGARRAIDSARQSAKTVPDAALRQRVSAAVDISDGVVLRHDRPGDSLRVLDAAVGFYSTQLGRTLLPKIFLSVDERTFGWETTIWH